MNPDAKINGDGTVPEGTYGTITLNGAGTVTGDIVCAELKVNGAGRCRGAVRADRITVNGSATFDGSVQAGEFIVNGNADVHAGMGVARLKVFGSLTLDGGVAAHEFELKGEIRTGGDLSANRVSGHGRVIVNGDLRADDIDLRLNGRSSAKDVVGGRIILRAPEGFAAVLSAIVDRELKANSVSGTELQLIDTVTSLVRGTTVTLGEGCRIGRAEYSEALHKLEGALVTEEMKV